jgi:peptide/nickel transport system substrate-binding protein
MKIMWLLVLCSWLSVVAAPLEGASDKPKRGGTLTLGISREPVLMHPMIATGSVERKVRELMFESLLGVDANGKIQPNLAESWSISDNGRLYTFNLRKGVKFHDGREMTGEDVKYAVSYAMNPKNGAYGQNMLAPVERVETEGKHVVKMFLKKPSPPFLASLTDIQPFAVVPKESLPEGVSKLERFPPGTGPFKVVEWQPGQRFVFERAADYWGHKAFIDRLILRTISDGTIRFTAVQTGDVDMIEFTPFEWVKQVAEGKIKGLYLVKAPYASFRRLVFNAAAPPFSNKKMRQAVAYAIDKRELMHAGFFGYGEPVDQRYPAGHSWFIEGFPPQSRDLAKAAALLKEAGYKGDAISVNSYPGEYEPMITTLQAQLKKVGMNVTIENMDFGAHRGRIRSGDYTMNVSGGNLETDPYEAYGANRRCESDLKKRRNNLSGHCDKEVEALLDKAEQESNDAKRRALIKQILNKHFEDVAEVYIGFAPRFFALRDYVKGFNTSGDDIYRWWGGGLNHTWLDK